MKEKMAIDVVLVNWNSGSQLAEAIVSIAQNHRGLVSSVIIVDNASMDSSLAQIELLTDLPFNLQIIHNPENLGFGAACNQGVALAHSEYLLFLNPDTRLFDNSLRVPITFLRRPENADVGIVGIQLEDENNHVARSCARLPTLGMFFAQALGINRLPGLRHLNIHMVDWAHDRTETVNHVMGAFFLMRRPLFDILGGFDERFFVYLEDLDLSLRARKIGWRSVYLAEAKAFHAGGGISRQVKAARLFYSLQSRLLYGFKHFSRIKAWALVLITLLIEPWSRLFLAMTKRSFADVRHTVIAYGMLIRELDKILQLGLARRRDRGLVINDKVSGS